MNIEDLFRKIANKTSQFAGKPITFIIALLIIILWGFSGHLFHYSDTWQLVINTGTTIITFLMIFLVQNTQNRDSHALHLKLDELIYSSRRARNHLMNLDKMSDQDLKELQKEFDKLAEKKNERSSISRSRDL